MINHRFVLRTALICATLFSVWATFARLLLGPSTKPGPGLAVVVGAYYAAALGATAVIRVLAPLARWVLGRYAIGAAAAGIVALSVGTAMEGDPRNWNSDAWFPFVVTWLMLVAVAVAIVRRWAPRGEADPSTAAR